MLVIDNLLARRGARRRGNDDGAVLVTVVVIMLVGFIVAATIAAAVMFTIQSNHSNQGRTQAFIAAESGRDQAVATLAGAINSDGELVCTPALLSGSGADPEFTFSIRSTTNIDRPVSWDESGVVDACPTPTSTFVVVRSEGTGRDGSTSTIDSVFPWRITHVEQPAGTMAYFDGEFKATKSTYQGDLVVRGTGTYTCNNSSIIDGDLWVVKANVILSTDCEITGSIYAFGTVNGSSSGIKIGGDIIAGGDISIASNGVEIGGTVHSGNKIALTGTGSTTGTVGGDVIARSTATVDPKWRHPDNSLIVPVNGGPIPVFEPTLDDVFEVTKWLELASVGIWGSPSSTPKTTTYTTCDAATIRAAMSDTSSGRALFDMSGCLKPNGKVAEVYLSGSEFTLARDAVFYVPAGKEMDLRIDTPIRKAGDPQLLIIHGDANGADGAPSSCTKQDSLAISATVEPRLMIYSPCGLNGNITVSFSGQLYTANSGNHLVLSNFVCTPMGWLPAFGNLSCGIKGPGGALDTSKDIASIDPLIFQTER